ncbi:hypothetical protein FB45DRAFT_874434 [Roridomyces roridus]|uniref:Uncharacterized protein n=1 Tax=Roridomyces roridus TaxID=1738132 RepID=A0AAD7B804_9AGAR|nr:hypothetical protein FB45DRAFT_874434 [Roridomyces roridus]
MNTPNTHRTRATTRAGLHPPPPPLFSPQANADGASEAGDPDVGRNSAVPAASTTGGNADRSSALPTLTQSNIHIRPDVLGSEPASDEDEEGWIPVTRKTRRSHSGRSSDEVDTTITIHPASSKPTSDVHSVSSTTTVDKATHSMSLADLEANARRYQALSNKFSALAHGRSHPTGTSVDAQKESGGKSPKNEHKGMLIDFDGEVEELVLEEKETWVPHNADAGPSKKGKGVDPANWGGIPSLHNFSEKDLKRQQEMLANYAEINRIAKEEEKSARTSHNDFTPVVTSTPARNHAGRQRSKSPKASKASAHSTAPVGNTPSAAQVPEAPATPVGVSFVPPATAVAGDKAANGQETNPAPDLLSGLFTTEEIISLVNEKITQLTSQQLRERESTPTHTAPPVDEKRRARTPREPTPPK